MKPTDNMLDLAFQFKSVNLWEKMYDSEMYAVQLSDGEIAYCCIMGMLGEHLALGMYVGESGLRSYLKLQFSHPEEGPVDILRSQEILTSQDCIQCSFEDKGMLTEDEIKCVKQFAKKKKIRLSGSNAYPWFLKLRPGRFPWEYDSILDQGRICEGLSAAIALSRLLESKKKRELGLLPIQKVMREADAKAQSHHKGQVLFEGMEDDIKPVIPLLSRKETGGADSDANNGEWTVTPMVLPELHAEYPTPKFENMVLTEFLRQGKKNGVWECGTMYSQKAVQDPGAEGEAPYYPLILMALNQENGKVLEPVIVKDSNPIVLLNEFAEKMYHGGSLPQTILVGDERCQALLRDLCDKTGIQLQLDDNLKELAEAEFNLTFNLSYDELDEDEKAQFDSLMGIMSDLFDDEDDEAWDDDDDREDKDDGWEDEFSIEDIWIPYVLGDVDTVGDLIRDRRIEYGLSQSELAKVSGAPLSMIKGMERGKQMPTEDALARMLDALAVSEDNEDDDEEWTYARPDKNDIGVRVRIYRKRRGMNQTQLAKASGVSQGTLSALENGRRVPGLEKMEKIAAALEITISDLLE